MKKFGLFQTDQELNQDKRGRTSIMSSVEGGGTLHIGQTEGSCGHDYNSFKPSFGKIRI